MSEDEEFDAWQDDHAQDCYAWCGGDAGISTPHQPGCPRDQGWTHEQRMHTLHEVSQRRLACNDLGPAECTCTRTWFEPRGESGDWKEWEEEYIDPDHNAVVDTRVKIEYPKTLST
jgi:hypothetical protein